MPRSWNHLGIFEDRWVYYDLCPACSAEAVKPATVMAAAQILLNPDPPAPLSINPQNIFVGDWVEVPGSNESFKVELIDGDQAVLNVGGRIPLSKLKISVPF